MGMQFAGMIMVVGLALGTGCGKKGGDSAPAAGGSPAAKESPKENAKESPKGAEKGKTAPPGPADPNFERFTNAGADNQIDVPKDWGHNPVGDALVITSPDKQVFIELSASLAMGKDKAD
jgi:hypothetical protein